MKKITLLFSIIALAVFAGCTKEGPAGPAGANGSSIIMATDTFTVNPADWSLVNANYPYYYKLEHTNTAITQKIVDNGTIQVFSKSTTYPDWYAWPDVVAGNGQAGFRFSYNVGKLTLLGDNFQSGPPSTYTIKAVIMQ